MPPTKFCKDWPSRLTSNKRFNSRITADRHSLRQTDGWTDGHSDGQQFSFSCSAEATQLKRKTNLDA